MPDNDIKQATKTTMDTAGTVAGTIAKEAESVANDVGATVRDAAHKVSSAASDIGQEAVARGTRYGKTVMEEVEAQPVMSLLIAAAAGVVAGLLLARR